MAAAAVSLARAAGYANAGTVEFVYDVETGRFYFLEMNTRIQVEHPVTETVTGVDLVREQIQVASGKPLSFSQNDIKQAGHAVECRINAEDAMHGFRPSPGKITRWAPPRHPAARLDTHCFQGYVVPPYYDSMIAKVITRGDTRMQALDAMSEYLADFAVEGITTTIAFQREVIRSVRFRDGTATTNWAERELLAG